MTSASDSNLDTPPIDASMPDGGDGGTPPSNVATIAIEEEMQTSFLDYAMSVIVSRALPDVRDGLKPVHRRILYAMKEGGYVSGKPYRKSARIVGDVMGQYHPHGDSALYDAMARMAQDFSMRVPLVDGQGNFGSMDGDRPAAMRYTEARSAKVAELNFEDLDKDTVDFQPNYDESLVEPTVLPARFPNLLVNGANGIAVGMATNIPPHNLGEVLDACHALLDNPQLDDSDLGEFVKGPDFPTGGIILGHGGIHKLYATGNGSIRMRGRADVEEIRKDRMAIIISEIPYQVNKRRLIERIAEVTQQKIVEGISDIRDESDRDGVRIVIELKRDAVADVVLNQIYKFTPLQTTFSGNMLALHNGRPQQMSLSKILNAFIAFREDVIQRRTKYLLRKARARAHILIGLSVAVANIDRVIKLIRSSGDPASAKEALIAENWPAGDVIPLIELVKETNDRLKQDGTYQLSDLQAQAILDLRLHRLTGLERDKLADELRGVVDSIQEYLTILGDRAALLDVMRQELTDVREKYATPRRTEILIDFEGGDIDIEDLIAREDMVVTISNAGYAKRVPLSTYRAQNRGGKGRSGANLKDEDIITDVRVVNTHTELLFFTDKGRVYPLKCYRLPEAAPNARGKALVNLLPLEPDEHVTTLLPLPSEDDRDFETTQLMFVTANGSVRRNALTDFTKIRQSGIIAMKLADDDQLIGVRMCTKQDDILLASRLGKAVRFSATDIRLFVGRNSSGVRGIKLADNDEVVGLAVLANTATTAEQRSSYLRLRNAVKRLMADKTPTHTTENGDDATVEAGATGNIPQEFYDQAAADLGADVANDLPYDLFCEMARDEQFILTVSDKGYGKRTSGYEYRRMNRGGQGVANMSLSKRTGDIIATYRVVDEHDIIMITNQGQLIRIPVAQIRTAGRSTQGVRVFRVPDEARIVSVARVLVDDDEISEDVSEESKE